MIVIDASVTALALLNERVEPRARAAREALREDPAWCVPEHWRIEVLSVVRGLLLGGKIDDISARRAVATIAEMTVAVVDTAAVAPRVWELRGNLTAYDAAYVAVAEARDATLVTADARIARVNVARCEIRLID